MCGVFFRLSQKVIKIPTQSNLMGTGCAPLQAQASVGLLTNSQAASGATQGAQPLLSDFVVFTSGTVNTGPTLPATGPQCNAGDNFIIVNHSGVAMSVFPPTGGKIANGTVNTAFSVPNNKTGFFLSIGSNNFAASLSA